MATVVNNPNGTDNSSTNMVLGIILLLLAFAMLWFFGYPYFANQGQNTAPTENTQMNIQEQPAPVQDTSQTNEDPMFVVPEDIDITVDGEVTNE